MSKWKRLAMITLSTSILMTQGVPLSYLAYATETSHQAQINGDVNFSWTTTNQIMVGTKFDPYEGLQAIDADGDNVSLLVQVSGEVDTSRLGTYSITYSIKNTNDEIFTMSRQIEVTERNSINDEITEAPDNQEEQTPDNQEEVAPSVLKDVAWTLYDQLNQQELIKLILNTETGYYEAHISEMLKSLLENIDEETLNLEVLRLLILSEKENEKLSITLTVRDLLGETDVLKSLKELQYEINDQLSLIPISNEKTNLVVDGVTGGDISNEQAGYENGVQNEDYLHNVRFKLTEYGLKTIYNEAPIIEGAVDTEVLNFELFDPKAGIQVIDDHDENLLPNLQSIITQVDENNYQITYQVTDSWGRTTEVIRQIIDNPDNDVNQEIGYTIPSTTLADNTITVRGILYPNTNSLDKRFDITFNPRKKRIYITNNDGRSMNSRVDGDYFKLTLYNSQGVVKNELVLKGRDRAASYTSQTMTDLINVGWRYSIGDVISIWHYEPNSKISISGTIQDIGNDNFNSNVTSDSLRLNRFELTENGFKKITNTAPTISLNEGINKDITIKRGDKLNVLEGLLIADDHDDVNHLEYDITEIDNLQVGTQLVTIKVTDRWGESATFNRQVTVENKNNLDAIRIKFLNDLGSSVFDLHFDDVTKQIKLLNQTDTVFESGDSSDIILVSIYNRSGKIRRTVRIKGTDNGNSASIRALQNFKYNEGDYIHINPKNTKFIQIDGMITDKNPSIDYSTTLTDLDYYKNVRFQIENGQFKYVYNEPPVIHGVTPKNIVRGEKFNPLDDVYVTDDKDLNISTNDIRVTYHEQQLNSLGETIVRYSVSDSWGRNTVVDRKITVIAPNDIENYALSLKKDSKKFISFGFDSLTRKLRVIDYLPNEVLDGDDSKKAFTLTLYGPNHQSKSSVTLDYHTEISDSFVQEVEAMIFEDGDYLIISTPLYNSFEMTKANETIATFNSSEELENSRLQISNENVKVIYNNAPTFNGVDNVRIVYGNRFDPKQRVSVQDDEENLNYTITGEHINNQDEFTATEIGTYQLTYSVIDSYGRKTEVIRTVEIVPVYTTNEIQYYNEFNQLLFAIGINESATGFTYRLPETSNLSDSSLLINSANETKLDVPNQTLFKFIVYDNHGVIVDVLEVTEQTIINDDLFETLTATQVRPDYRFSIEANNLNQLKLTGRLEKDDIISTIDYANLTEADTDAVKNVRFELTENIVKAIYNEAPVINIAQTPSDSVDPTGSTLANNTNTTIIRNKALTKEEYNLLEGVTVDDDKDKLILTVDNITVEDQMLVSDLTQSTQTIGNTYTVTYQVTDSWGRQSAPVTRQVIIQSAMDDVKLNYRRANLSLQDIGLALQIGFDMENNRLEFKSDPNNNQFKDAPGASYGSIIITSPTNETLAKFALGKNSIGLSNPNHFDRVLDKPSLLIQELKNLSISYGTKFNFEMLQSPFLFIDGNVVDAKENYATGSKLGEILKHSTFIVTPEGLKQEYTEIIVDNNFPQLTWFNGVAGARSVNVTLDTSDSNNLHFSVEKFDNEPLDTLYRDSIFQIIVNKNGENKQYTVQSRETADRFEQIFKTYIGTVSVGDYISIRNLNDRRLENLKFLNLSEGMYFPEKVDYSSIISNRDYFDHVRFYFSRNGIVPVYNKGPVFNGVDEVDVIVGTEFNPREGVTVTDEIDGNIPTFTVSSETINTSQVGTQMITYTATDTWGRRTTHNRQINIRPSLFDNKIQVFASNETNQPAFEIIFDNQKESSSTKASGNNSTNNQRLGGFIINRYITGALDISLATQDVFKIWVLNADGTEKAKVSLQGRDTAESSKLSVLESIDYKEGDIIKVWRHPSISQESEQIDTLKITGQVFEKDTNNKVDFTDGLSTVEKMNNTLFKVSNNGLSAYYNEAPTFISVEDKVIYYGDPFDKLQGVSVTDDYETLTLTEENVSTNFVPNTMGNYTATYTITDNFGRTSTKTIAITVKSKLEKNKFNIYGETTDNTNELKFSIGFNDKGNKLILLPSPNQIEKIASQNNLQIIIYNRNGVKKHDLMITQEDNEEVIVQKLAQLQNLTLSTNDSISIMHNNPNFVKIDGEVQDSSHDYSNGFNDNMSEVRFQLTHHGLKEIKASDFTININGNLTIKRGDDYDLFNGVTITHPTENILPQRILVNNFDINHIGTQTVTYTVTDSWGKQATATRQVIVEALNALDEGQINLHSEMVGAKRLTIGFDALRMKLTAIAENHVLSKILKDLPEDEVVFSLSIYNSAQELQANYQFIGNDINNHSQIMAQINEQPFNYGDYIAITAYNYEKLDFNVNIELDDHNKEHPSSEIISADQVNKEDFIINARFKITENGLMALYNEAPTITKVNPNEDIELEIGEEDKLIQQITFDDDLDELTSSNVEITTEADFYYPGKYEVTYTVTDTWGRSKSLKTPFYVLSALEKNDIIVKSFDNHQELFRVQFNSKTQQLNFLFNDTNNSALNSSKGTKEVITVTIYNAEGQKMQSIPLIGEDTKESIQQKLSPLMGEYEYHYGYFIHVEITDESTQDIIVTNVELESNLIPENSYQEGHTTNRDYFENVRFELDAQLGLVALYNEAPILNLDNESMEHIKSPNIADYDLFSGITLSDDRDLLDPDVNIKIYCNPIQIKEVTDEMGDGTNNILNAANLHLGDNKIYYVAVDNWGRTSEPKMRTLTLTHGMKNTSIVFDYVNLLDNSDTSTDMPAMTVQYDPDTNKLYATRGEGGNKFKTTAHAYTLDIYNDSEERVFGAIYGSGDIPLYEESEYYQSGTTHVNRHNDPQVAANQITNFFADKEVVEGWSIRVRSAQSPFLKINGIILDAQEDYSEGARIGEILSNSKFYITEEGLKQEYIPETIEKGKSKITWYSGVAGMKQFSLVYDSSENTLTVETAVEPIREPLDTLYKQGGSNGSDLFRIGIYSADGEEKFNRWFKSREYSSTVKSAIESANLSLSEGDYLEIELIERRRTNMRIYGDLIQPKGNLELESYRTGVPDLTYYNEARFYFTDQGLSLDYNEAPTFTGIEDTVLFTGEEPLNLKSNISVQDDNTPNISYKVTGNSFNVENDNYDNIEELPDNYSTNNPGAQEIYYVAKDSLGRITVEPRFIWVYARSQITIKDESKLIVQEADPKLRTEDAVYQYLIDLVQVTDEEDDANGNPIQVTKDNINTDFNPMKPGTYDVTYTVEDSDNNVSTKTFEITVVRSINVSVPRNNIPFQVVTNLLDATQEGQEFISGTIKVINNYVTDVTVSVKSLTIQDDQPTSDGNFTLVDPNGIDWSTLSENETMSKMALGLYAKSGFVGSNVPTEESPIWLTPNMSKVNIGTLPKGTILSTTQVDSMNTGITPSEATLSFTAKYGKNFTAGKHRMKFTMILEFE